MLVAYLIGRSKPNRLEPLDCQIGEKKRTPIFEAIPEARSLNRRELVNLRNHVLITVAKKTVQLQRRQHFVLWKPASGAFEFATVPSAAWYTVHATVHVRHRSARSNECVPEPQRT